MNSYLENAYNDEAIDEAVKRAVPCPTCLAHIGEWCIDGETGPCPPHPRRLEEGYDDFREMVAKMSLDGLSLSDIARKLGLVPQRFTAYHAKWMREHAEPLDLEDV